MVPLHLAFLASALTLSGNAWASHSVYYSDDRYTIEIGVTTCDLPPPEDWEPCAGPVRITRHGESGSTKLDDGLTVEGFNPGRSLTLRYDGRDPEVDAFYLIVRGERASLHMKDHVRHTDFSWFM